MQNIPLNLIQFETDFQARVQMSSDMVQEYAEAMEQGATFPPVVVFSEGSGKLFYLADGYHRVAAALRLGRDEIAAEVNEGNRRNAILYAVGANASHGLRRTSADKRRAVEMLLRDEEWRQWSDREIARRAAVDHKTVGKVRAALVAAGEIPQIEERKTATGTVMSTNNIGTNQPSKEVKLDPYKYPDMEWFERYRRIKLDHGLRKILFIHLGRHHFIAMGSDAQVASKCIAGPSGPDGSIAQTYTNTERGRILHVWKMSALEKIERTGEQIVIYDEQVDLDWYGAKEFLESLMGTKSTEAIKNQQPQPEQSSRDDALWGVGPSGQAMVKDIWKGNDLGKYSAPTRDTLINKGYIIELDRAGQVYLLTEKAWQRLGLEQPTGRIEPGQQCLMYQTITGLNRLGRLEGYKWDANGKDVRAVVWFYDKSEYQIPLAGYIQTYTPQAAQQRPDLPERQIEFLIALENRMPLVKNAATRHALRGHGLITMDDDWQLIQLTPAGKAWLEIYWSEQHELAAEDIQQELAWALETVLGYVRGARYPDDPEVAEAAYMILDRLPNLLSHPQQETA